MRSQSLQRRLFWTLVLFGLWVLLSESYEPTHLGVGLVAAIGVAALNSRPSPTYAASLRWVRVLAYFPWLFGRILASGMHLAYLILHPRLPIDPVLFRYRTQLPNDHALMLLGNSITLTPGTITVEAEAGELVVHALDDKSTGDLASSTLERKVRAVFRAGGDPA